MTPSSYNLVSSATDAFPFTATGGVVAVGFACGDDGVTTGVVSMIAKRKRIKSE